MATIDIEAVKPHIGGIVHVDRARLCDDEVVQACREGLEKHGVLVFPRMNLTDEQQLAFTDKLGDRVNFTRSVPGGSSAAPDVYEITLNEQTNQQPEYVLGTWFWHIDGVTMNIPLPKATLLTARKLSDEGGQTEFANTYAAYDALSDEMKQKIEGLEVLHTLESSLRQIYDDPGPERLERWRNQAVHMVRPLVWEHESGRKSLLIGNHADRVLGMRLADGRALLSRLLEWTVQPAFTYTHEWQEGDLVIWNNSGTMHRVVPYAADSGRSMHRTTIAGSDSVKGSYPYEESAVSA